jgi:predicted phosphoadenosine phosphosulfate sulfurtransferase
MPTGKRRDGKKMIRELQTLDRDVLEMAYERLEIAFERFDSISVMFSGGKDSTVCLNLAVEVARRLDKLPVDAVFQDEEAIPLQTVDYVRRVGQTGDVNLRWYCLPLKHRNACSRKHPYWSPWAPEDEEKWVRPLPPEGITRLKGFPIYPVEKRLTAPDANGLFYPPSEHGNVGMVMGIRAQESLTRRRAVTRKKYENYLIPYDGLTDNGNLTKVYPIYDWNEEDVWTAPKLLNWDYNEAYDRLEMAGVPSSVQRCSPAYGEEPLQKLWTYAQAFPEVWDKMVERVPGAATAARYALTELYAYHGRPQRPPDMSWEDFLMSYVAMYRPKEARLVAERVKYLIGLHYSKTSDPILEDTPHPETGTSWNWLLMVAMRGDFKFRKQPGGRVQMDPTLKATAWAKYERERAEALA